MSEEPIAEANWQTMPQKAISTTTIAQLEKLITEAYQQKLEVEKHETAKSEANKVFENTKSRILSIFQEFGKTSYSTGRGNVVRVKRFNVTMPKEPKAKTALFNYLKEKDVFESLVTVHASTLNSFFKAEMESAIENGATKFEMPGVGEPKYSETLALRSK